MSKANSLVRLLPILGLLGVSTHGMAFAQDNAVKSPETTTAPALEKPNPTSTVAGGVGEQGYKPPQYAVLPTGKTLPKGIFHTEFITANTFGHSGFDEDGHSGNQGLDYNRWMGGLKVQYGLSNSISLAIGIPYVYSNTLSMDGNAFKGTTLYKKYFNAAVNSLVSTLRQVQPGYATTATSQNIMNGYTLAQLTAGSAPVTSSPLVLPTGEIITLDSNSSVKDQLSNSTLQAAAPASGATGVGDIQLGFLWNAISENSPIRQVPLYFSIGGGMRFPTGKFNLPSALRATGGDNTLQTGGGTLDALLRWNVDYVATPGLILSWQHQMEVSLNSVNLCRNSALETNQCNTADVNQVNTNANIGRLNTGDGVPNTLRFSRKGIHEVGFVQAAWGLGNVNPKMKFLGLYTQAKYNIAAQAFLNDKPISVMGDQYNLDDVTLHPETAYEQYYSAVLGSKVSGLPYMIPLEVSAEFEYPFAGKNRAVSPMNAQVVVGVYF